MHYKEVVKLKEELRELNYKLDVLKSKEPSEENWAEVRDIERRTKSIQNYIRMRSRQYGFSA